MSLSIEIDYKELEDFAESLGASPEIAHQEMARAMYAALTLMEARVVDKTPVNTAALRSSIYVAMHGTPPNLWGEVATGISYGEPVEYGRKAGKKPPPIDAIQMWVVRKNITGTYQTKSGKTRTMTDRQMAFLIARAIGKRGTKPGAKMFQKTFEGSRGEVRRILDRVPEQIVRRLAN